MTTSVADLELPLQREHARTIFEKGGKGRRAFTCPGWDVPEVDMEDRKSVV